MENNKRAFKSMRVSHTGPTGMRKPLTDADKFCAFSKNLGYSIPSHTKPEHYEYLIQNDELAQFFKALNKKILPTNVLDTSDLERFDTIVEDGGALFGEDLEMAISRVKHQELEAAKNTQRVIDQHKAYDQSIEDKQRELERLQSVNNEYTNTMTAKEVEEKYINAKEAFLKSEAENLKTYLLVKQKELTDILDELQTFLKTVKTTAAMGQSRTNFADKDWRSLIANEETLIKIINSMESEFLQRIVDNVNTGDFGFGIGRDRDTSGQIQQNLKDLDRLKHIIVFENLRELKYNLEMAAITNVIEKISSIREEICLLASVTPAIRQGMLAEVQEQNGRLSKLNRSEADSLLQQQRNDRASILSSECREILDRQFYVKRKLRKFHTFIMKTLVHQRVRLDTTKELIRAEKFSDSKIAENFENFNNFMFRRFEREEMLLQELLDSAKGEVTSDVSEYFDRTTLSSEASVNPLQAFQNFLSTETKKQKDKIKELEQCQIELYNQVKNYRLHLQMLQQLYSEIVKSDAIVTPPQQHLSLLLQRVSEKRETINNLTQNKDKIVKESIEKKKESLLRAQEMIRKRKCDSGRSDGSVKHSGLDFPPVTDH